MKFAIFVSLPQCGRPEWMKEEGNIIVRRAKVNNLKDVTVEIF